MQGFSNKEQWCKKAGCQWVNQNTEVSETLIN